MLLDAQPSTLRYLQGWTSTLPLGVDPLACVAASTPSPRRRFPFVADGLARPMAESSTGSPPTAAGSCSGTGSPNTTTTANPRSLGRRQELPRQTRSSALALSRHRHAVVDPENEYRRLAKTVGGAHVQSAPPGCGQSVRPRPRTSILRTRCPHPTGAVRPHADRRPPRRQAFRPGVDSGARPGDRRRLRASVGITADVRSHARPAPTSAGT